MKNTKSVLLVGWHPDAVDYSKWPGLTPEKLYSAFDSDMDEFKTQGYDAELGLIKNADTAAGSLIRLLTIKQRDCVLIGAGVRTVPEYLQLFEVLVNTVHEYAPKAKLCFNSGPLDSVAAVHRWLKPDFTQN